MNLARLPALLTPRRDHPGDLHGAGAAWRDIGLLAVVGSIGDTMSDEYALRDLKLWNKGGTADVITRP